MSIAANLNSTESTTAAPAVSTPGETPWKDWDLSGSLLQISANFSKKGLVNPTEGTGAQGTYLIYPFHNGALCIFGNNKAKLEIYPLGGKMVKSPEGEVIVEETSVSKAQLIKFDEENSPVLGRLQSKMESLKELMEWGTKAPHSFGGLKSLVAQKGCDKVKIEVWLDPSVAKRMARGGAKAAALRLTVPTAGINTRIEPAVTKEGVSLSILKMGVEAPYLEWREKAEGDKLIPIPTWVWEEDQVSENEGEDANIFNLSPEIWERLYPAAKAARNLPSDSPQKWFYTIMGAAPRKVEEGYVYNLLRREPELTGKVFDYLKTTLEVGLKGVEPFVGNVVAPRRQCPLVDANGQKLEDSILTMEQVQAWLSFHYSKITSPANKGGVLQFTPTTDSSVVAAPTPITLPEPQTFIPTESTPTPTPTPESEPDYFEGEEVEFNWDDF